MFSSRALIFAFIASCQRASLTASIKLVGLKEEEKATIKCLCEKDKCWDERY